jgi:cell division protein FtsA
MAVLKEEELGNGVLLVDSGGGTTDIALYKGGTLRFASVIPVGGLHFTNDVSVGLKLPQKEAERLKRRFGAGTDALEEAADALDMSGKPVRISVSGLAPIIRARCEELFELIRRDAAESMLKHPPLCAVLTGGGSLLKGMAEIAERWLSLPVRQGVPEDVKSPFLKEIMREPQYATAVGLLYYGLRDEEGERSGSLFGFLPGLVGQVKEKMMSRGVARKLLSRMHAGAGE